jgi:N-methylhydantoinase A
VSSAIDIRLAVDIGGTFTDVVLDGLGPDGAGRVTTKVLTTYEDPANGVVRGVRQVLQQASVAPSAVRLVLHGTTLATNALIERRGAVTALLTTEGHRDVIEMAFENRFEQYDIGIDRPAPLVPRTLRLPVPERLDAQGVVLRPLDLAALERLVPVLREHGVGSVAVGFLHAYANPVHEQRVGEWLRATLPDVSVSLSSGVCPEIREYERLSTTCANAYVKPLMARYLSSLERQLLALGIACPVLLMTSGGGLTTLATAAEFPIRLVESGPAGGAMLAARVAMEGGYERVLSFDMGGTTAKICLIDHGRPLLSRAFEVDRVYRFKKGSGLPVRIPVIEMVEIGAGGGSIAGVDKLGRITVGPASAGSEPGPACYGRGGTEPAVTDADLVLGRIQPAYFAGGSLQLDGSAARAALAARIGETQGLDSEQAAFAVGEVVDENMAAAARAHAVEWGTDVASRTLVAYGGAAPLHAAALADKLKIDRIVVPPGAGVGSAIGFLLAPVSYEVVRSRYQRLAAFQADSANAVMAEMHAEAAEVVRAAAPEGESGGPAGAWREVRRAYMRYVGQGYEIAVPVPAEPLTSAHGTVLHEAFETEYRRLYGRLIPDLDVEILSWTLTLVAREPAPPREVADPAARLRPVGLTCPLFDPAQGGLVDAALFLRDDLAPGDHAVGPALVVEDQTTTVVSSRFAFRVDGRGALVLERLADGERHD